MEEPRNAPSIRLLKMYLKDLSFESPNAPAAYMKSTEPQIELRLSLNQRRFDGDQWEVTLSIDATARSGEETLFIIEVEHAGLFEIRNVPQEHMDRLLLVECPTLLFPFTRQIVHQATADGGFPPLMVEPINFLGLFENRAAQRRPE